MSALLCVALSLVTTSASPAAAADDTSPSVGAADDADAPAAAPSTLEAQAQRRESDDDEQTVGDAPSLDAAVLELLFGRTGLARVAVAPIEDDDGARARRLEAAIARVLVEERLEAVLGQPAIDDEGMGADDEVAAPRAALAADHVILGEVRAEGGVPVLALRLVEVSSGRVVSSSSLPLARASEALATTRAGVSSGMALLVDDVVVAMAALPGELRYQRLAILPMTTTATGDEATGLARGAERELTRALAARGFLVVERARLDEAMSAAAELSDEGGAALARTLDAQALVVGTVAPAGDVLVVTVRVVAARDGAVLGTATRELARDGVVALSSDLLEVRTPSEALFRSAVAPGWGQVYNREPVKGSLVAAIAYGLAATTVLTGVIALGTRVSYELATPLPGEDPTTLAASLKMRRELADVLFLATAAGALLTVVVWAGNAVDAYLTASE